MMMMNFSEILKMVEEATQHSKIMYFQDEILDAATRIYMKQMEISQNEVVKENKRKKMYDDFLKKARM